MSVRVRPGAPIAVYLVIFVGELSIESQAIAIIAFLIHTQFIHFARGFKGDELLFISFSANSSALEPKLSLLSLCDWSTGHPMILIKEFMTG